MRIAGGAYRGRILKAPHGKSVRPTSDMVRQALFNILGPRIVDARVLDLFSGTGSVGLEALSRGAVSAAFVEKDRRVLDIIRENIASLGVEDRAIVRSFDVLTNEARLLELPGAFDIVFIDPPYLLMESIAPDSVVGTLLETIWAKGVVKRSSGVVVLQHDKRSGVSELWQNFRISDRRTYGDTALTFLADREL